MHQKVSFDYFTISMIKEFEVHIIIRVQLLGKWWNEYCPNKCPKHYNLYV